ncbi:MAG: indole-3-glycerol phosphate synthase TrpC [Nitrospirae bacterium]|nr:MAG: indole-3-glycerol phosphate synthase TrpC [Nitrospirota bacterium]
MILDKILEHKRREVNEKKNARYLTALKTTIRDLPAPIGFYRALAGHTARPSIGPAGPASIPRGETPRLIGEVKKASPSKGVIREDFDPLAVARTYLEHGASALSVLTDQEFFQGSLDCLRTIREEVPLPALNKEFMVDELQFYEARAHLADAVLLIVAALDRPQLIDFYHLARQEFGLDVLIEVHNERELDLVLERLPESRLIGINNRDLATFATSLDVTVRLAKRIPGDKLIVSESGIATRDDVKRVAEAGARAILVGEALMAAKDIGAKIRELIGPPTAE